jgi:23S rRNA (uracil1939-C5)-methyltransferase
MIHRGQILDLSIVDYAFGGRGIARIVDGETPYVVFVDNAFPGQMVRAKVDVKRKRYAEAKLIEVLHRSPVEVPSDFQEISGGPYIYVPIEQQKKYKLSSTTETFRRISGIQEVEKLFDEYIDSPQPYHYRNKMEYSFSCIAYRPETGEDEDDAFALGFKRRGTWWKVEDLNAPSGLFDETFESELTRIREYLVKSALPAWHAPQKKGFFRHLVVRKSFERDQLLINLVTSSDGLSIFDTKAFASFLSDLLGQRLAGVIHTINDNVADRAKIENGSSTLLLGQPVVVEKLMGLEFEISMESFFQTNPRCAEKLYGKALDYVFEDSEKSNKAIMDLFCGTGTIALLMSERHDGQEIIGVDIVEQAIEDARRNAVRNHVKDVEFFAADVGKFLKEHPEYTHRIGTIVLDPPRAGIAPKTLQKVIELNADVIVYISCNPSTQARDADSLHAAGYRLQKWSLVDQFPHTGHIESVARFVKHNA